MSNLEETSVQGMMMDQPLLLSTLLWRTERLFHDKEIVTRLGAGEYHRYTYADFGTRVRKFANALGALGVAPGERVATLGWNHYRHFEAYYGVPISGAVLHCVNLRLFADQQAYTINHAQDTVLVLDVDQIPLAEQLVEIGIPTVTKFVVWTDGEIPETTLSPVYSYEDLLTDASADLDYPQLDEDSACAICYTSATTGDPKGVVYSHRALVLQAMCLSMYDQLGMSNDQVWMVVAPMFHANAWNVPHAALMQGATLVLSGVHPAAHDYVETIEDLRVTGMNAAVTIATMMRDVINDSGRTYDLSSLRRMWLGGQAPSRAIMEWFADRFGTFVFQGYGMTECSPQVGFYSAKSTLADLPEDELWALRQTGGIPLPLMQIKVVGEDGRDRPWDGESIGIIAVRSPFTAGAYLDDDRTRESMIDGWFRTGDVGCIDSNGYISLKDRSKDLIKSGGEWISSIDLENALMAHPKVREATVVAVPHEKWVERPIACVVPSCGSVTEGELRAHLRQTFASWWIPDAFVFVAEVPKTSVGKFDKKRLRAQLSSEGIDELRAEHGSETSPV